MRLYEKCSCGAGYEFSDDGYLLFQTDKQREIDAFRSWRERHEMTCPLIKSMLHISPACSCGTSAVCKMHAPASALWSAATIGGIA